MRHKIRKYLKSFFMRAGVCTALMSASACVPIATGSLVTAPLKLLMEHPADQYLAAKRSGYDKQAEQRRSSHSKTGLSGGRISVAELLAKARGEKPQTRNGSEDDRPFPHAQDAMSVVLVFARSEFHATPGHLGHLGNYLSETSRPANSVVITTGPGSEKDKMTSMLTGMRRAKSLARVLAEVGIKSEIKFDPLKPSDTVTVIPNAGAASEPKGSDSRA